MGVFNLGRGAVTVGTTSMGNCSNFSFSASATILDHPSYVSGLREVEQIIIEWSYQGSFTTDTLSTAILQIGLGSGVSGGSDATKTIAFTGAAGIVGNNTVSCSIPTAIVELGSANLINGDDWSKITINFKGKVTGTDTITITGTT